MVIYIEDTGNISNNSMTKEWFLKSKLNEFVLKLYWNSFHKFTDFKTSFILFDMLQFDAVRVVAIELSDVSNEHVPIQQRDDKSELHTTLIKKTINTLQSFHSGVIPDIMGVNYVDYEERTKLKDIVTFEDICSINNIINVDKAYPDGIINNLFNVECGTFKPDKILHYIFSNECNLCYFVPYNSELVYGFMKVEDTFKDYCYWRLGPIILYTKAWDLRHDKIAERLRININTAKTQYSVFSDYLNSFKQ